jgi:predicted nucleic acid-binding Zn ribbon protein
LPPSSPGFRSARDRKGRPARSRDPQPLGEVLDQLLASRPWAAGRSLGELGRRWGQVVGERLAQESVPGGLEGGVLVVRVSSSAWAAQIRFLARDIAARANQVMGELVVTEVKVVVAEGRPGT